MRIGKNQYLLLYGNREDIECCNRIYFDEYTVFLGEKCDSFICEQDDDRFLLLGYVSNTSSITCNFEAEAKNLLKTISPDCRNVSKITENWGGRWCAFVKKNGKLLVFGDACSLKQIFYYSGENIDCIAVASQARYIAEVFNLLPNEDAERYIALAQEKDKEFSYPLNKTRYSFVERVLPNHILDVRNKKVTRMSLQFFSNKNTSDIVCHISSILMSGVCSAASARPMAVTLTGGLDSRLLFASCYKSLEKFDVVTLKYSNMRNDSHDLLTAKEICKECDVKHNVLDCKNPSAEYIDLYCAHAENPHEFWMQTAFGAYDCGYGDFLWCKGSCNEVVSLPNGILKNKNVTPQILCKMFSIPITDFSISAIDKWLLGAKSILRESQISLIDLFYWEHRMGSWLAECLNEYDVIGETFTPFNVRSYINLVYPLDSRLKIPPKYKIFDSMLRESNLDSNRFPINNNKYKSIKAKLYLLLKYKFRKLYSLFWRFKKGR